MSVFLLSVTQIESASAQPAISFLFLCTFAITCAAWSELAPAALRMTMCFPAYSGQFCCTALSPPSTATPVHAGISRPNPRYSQSVNRGISADGLSAPAAFDAAACFSAAGSAAAAPDAAAVETQLTAKTESMRMGIISALNKLRIVFFQRELADFCRKLFDVVAVFVRRCVHFRYRSNNCLCSGRHLVHCARNLLRRLRKQFHLFGNLLSTVLHLFGTGLHRLHIVLHGTDRLKHLRASRRLLL